MARGTSNKSNSNGATKTGDGGRKKEAKLGCCMITQDYVLQHWSWDTADSAALSSKDTQAIAAIIRRKLDSAGMTVAEMYVIQHDKDEHNTWDDTAMKWVVDYKTSHIHAVIKFKDKCGGTVNQIAAVVGLESQYVQRPARGRYAYDNMLSYMTHIKYLDKHQYKPDEVITVCGKSYNAVYHEREQEWIKGRAKLVADKHRADIDWLEQMILTGQVKRNQVLLTDEYYEVYARNKRRCDDAFDTYAERKIYKAIQALNEGAYRLCVYFITGRSGAGKSRFTDALVANILKSVRETMGEQWEVKSAAASNPFDTYRGEEVLVMDDVRGVALTASDWLKLLDAERVHEGSARYSNRIVAPRVIIINSEKDVLQFFYYVKQSGGGDRSEAMDQFLRRIMAHITVYKVPDSADERRVNIGLSKEVPEYTAIADREAFAADRSAIVSLHYGFDKPVGLSDMPYDAAIGYLTARVMAANGLEDEVYYDELRRIYAEGKDDELLSAYAEDAENAFAEAKKLKADNGRSQ